MSAKRSRSLELRFTHHGYPTCCRSPPLPVLRVCFSKIRALFSGAALIRSLDGPTSACRRLSVWKFDFFEIGAMRGILRISFFLFFCFCFFGFVLVCCSFVLCVHVCVCVCVCVCVYPFWFFSCFVSLYVCFVLFWLSFLCVFICFPFVRTQMNN